MTAAKMIANRANAQHSTGPQDTSATRFNGVQHGLTSKQTVIPGESQQEYDEFRQGVPNRPRRELRAGARVSRSHRSRSLETQTLRASGSRLLQQPHRRLLQRQPRSRPSRSNGKSLHRSGGNVQDAPVPPLPDWGAKGVRQSPHRVPQNPEGTSAARCAATP